MIYKVELDISGHGEVYIEADSIGEAEEKAYSLDVDELDDLSLEVEWVHAREPKEEL